MDCMGVNIVIKTNKLQDNSTYINYAASGVFTKISTAHIDVYFHLNSYLQELISPRHAYEHVTIRVQVKF